MPTLAPEPRFLARYSPQPDGCWLWTGGHNDRGYAKFSINGKSTYAHRWAYEHFVGPIPAGLYIDHLCRTPGCVNPAHLEPVTHVENVSRGISPTAANSRKTHCVHGHEFTPDNTMVERDGSRRCKTCHRRRNNARWARMSQQ